MARILAILILAWGLNGCAVVDWLWDCDDCALAPDEVEFSETETDGLLVFGLTVEAKEIPGQDFLGSIGWLANTTHGLDVREVTFPDDMHANQHRLMVWRVPAGNWSLRHARLGEGRHSSIGPVLSFESAATRIRPGHITLAGEIRVKDGPNGPELTYSPDTGFARQQLQAYHDVIAPTDDTPLVDMRRKPHHPPGSKPPESRGR